MYAEPDSRAVSDLLEFFGHQLGLNQGPGFIKKEQKRKKKMMPASAQVPGALYSLLVFSESVFSAQIQNPPVSS